MTLTIAVLISMGLCSQCWADACPVGDCLPVDVDAAAMVRAVRQSEQWIHQVDSLFLQMESVWTSPCACDVAGAGLRACPEGSATTQEAGQAQERGQPRGGAPTRGRLEYAFDKSRLRFLDDQPGECCSLKVWTGKELVAREVRSGRGEQYLLDATPEDNFDDILASETAWPRSQPHAFWWDRKDVDALAVFFGRPEEFKCIGRQTYRGEDCHVLEMRPTEVRAILHGETYGCDAGTEDQREHGRIGEVRGLVDQSCRWYVAVADGRLRGIMWLIAERPRLEHWMADYREIAAGAWFPMIQGYQVYNKDKDDRAYVERRRDLTVVKIQVNAPLADDLFHLDIHEGARVQDKRSGYPVTYEYRSKPADMLDKPLPSLTELVAGFDPASIAGQPVLLCFWDMDQRPSRHCMAQLVGQSQRLGELGVKIVTVRMGGSNADAIGRVREDVMPFPVLTPGDDLDSVRSAWNVRSLPWLVLADGNHVVRATGIAPDEVEAQLAGIVEQTGPWAAAPR